MKHQKLIDLGLLPSPINPRNQNDEEELNQTAKTLHLFTVDHLEVGFRPWLKFQSARRLSFQSARTGMAIIDRMETCRRGRKTSLGIKTILVLG